MAAPVRTARSAQPERSSVQHRPGKSKLPMFGRWARITGRRRRVRPASPPPLRGLRGAVLSWPGLRTRGTAIPPDVAACPGVRRANSWMGGGPLCGARACRGARPRAGGPGRQGPQIVKDAGRRGRPRRAAPTSSARARLRAAGPDDEPAPAGQGYGGRRTDEAIGLESGSPRTRRSSQASTSSSWITRPARTSSRASPISARSCARRASRSGPVSAGAAGPSAVGSAIPSVRDASAPEPTTDRRRSAAPWAGFLTRRPGRGGPPPLA